MSPDLRALPEQSGSRVRFCPPGGALTPDVLWPADLVLDGPALPDSVVFSRRAQWVWTGCVALGSPA